MKLDNIHPGDLVLVQSPHGARGLHVVSKVAEEELFAYPITPQLTVKTSEYSRLTVDDILIVWPASAVNAGRLPEVQA